MQKEEEHHLSSLLLKVEIKVEILQKTSGNKSYKTIASIKRFMGHSFAEITNEAKRVSYKVVKGTTIHHV
jgi:hypothetical protein